MWMASSLEARKAASSDGNSLHKARASSKFPEAANWTTYTGKYEDFQVDSTTNQWVQNARKEFKEKHGYGYRTDMHQASKSYSL